MALSWQNPNIFAKLQVVGTKSITTCPAAKQYSLPGMKCSNCSAGARQCSAAVNTSWSCLNLILKFSNSFSNDGWYLNISLFNMSSSFPNWSYSDLSFCICMCVNEKCTIFQLYPNDGIMFSNCIGVIWCLLPPTASTVPESLYFLQEGPKHEACYGALEIPLYPLLTLFSKLGEWLLACPAHLARIPTHFVMEVNG